MPSKIIMTMTTKRLMMKITMMMTKTITITIIIMAIPMFCITLIEALSKSWNSTGNGYFEVWFNL